MVNEEIKPCPFCGSDEDPVETNSRHYNSSPTQYDYYLECEGCDLLIGYDIGDDYYATQMKSMYGDISCKFSTKTEALNFWNERQR